MEGNIVSINDAATKYTELEKESSIGKHFNTVFNIEEGDFSDILRSANKGRRNNKKMTSIKIIDRDNNRRWINALSNVIEVNNKEYGVQLVLKEQLDAIQSNKIQNLLNDI